MTDILTPVSFIGLAGCAIAGATSIVIRFRQAEGIERHQLRSIAFGGVLFVTCWLVAAFGGATDAIGAPTRRFIITIGITMIPLTAGVAILRYGLYDIDWIIARALVYIPLTAALAGVHIALTGVLRAVLATGSGADMSVAITTVNVVAGLAPVKDYLQAQVTALQRRPRRRHGPRQCRHRDPIGGRPPGHIDLRAQAPAAGYRCSRRPGRADTHRRWPARATGWFA